jgi:hypothetical protein
LLDGFTEALWIERGIADELRLDACEKAHKEIFFDKAVAKHGVDIGKVTGVAAFQFRESLAVWIVMIEIELAVT